MKVGMRRTMFLALYALTFCSRTFADEGMWPFHNVPVAAIEERHDVELTRAWFDHVRTSIVRLANCTGSFVSPDGLILTNHHCAADCLDNLSTSQRNLLVDGFVTRQRDQERRCPTQLADVLLAMEDVTAKVAAAVAGLNAQAANEQRKKTLTQLEQACEQASRKDPRNGSLKCESVTLYDGGQYFIYKYKRYTDVRIAFAPEQAIAAFGGDPDNFQFPRWCLDMSLLRVYEDGKPVATSNYLRIDFDGPLAGEPVFVAGHPGSTDRLLTVSQLLELRNVFFPEWLLRQSELRGRLIQFGKQGAEQQRIVEDLLNSIENGIKVRRKQLDALLDDGLIRSKRAGEAALRDKLTVDRALAAQVGSPWQDIDSALQVDRALHIPYAYVEGGVGFNSQLFGYARALVRGVVERDKPNDQRLREYVDARLPRLEQRLAAEIPVYPQLERLTLSFSLERMREWLGPDDPLVRQLLAKASPDELAARLVEESKLNDAAQRMALWRGGANSVAESTDPMIVLARSIDAQARALRKRYEDEVEAPISAATEKIAAVRFAELGTRVYPDATFTLRLNDGSVRGWRENGEEVGPFTYLNRLFERATGADPFAIPPSWLAVKSRLDMQTPFNLSTNNDIVGGNSGSPLVDARGRIVGLIFDGNIHSISGAYWFDAEQNRAVAVHPAIMREALRKVYRADALLRELGVAD